VCGTRNFVSMRLYSAPHSHLTIVAILEICLFGRSVQAGSFAAIKSDPRNSKRSKFENRAEMGGVQRFGEKRALTPLKRNASRKYGVAAAKISESPISSRAFIPMNLTPAI
jgi:hypothetical protein